MGGTSAAVADVKGDRLTIRHIAKFEHAPFNRGVTKLTCDFSPVLKFKDRALMEGDPFSLVEAMTIAAYATGCERGYVYLRGEYPEALHALEHALSETRRRGFLGAEVMGEGFAFDIEIRRGAGAYICGEETAIFESIEGYRGEPRNKPPFPVEVGLFGRPTVVNNVETLVNVLDIVLRSGPAYAVAVDWRRSASARRSTGLRRRPIERFRNRIPCQVCMIIQK